MLGRNTELTFIIADLSQPGSVPCWPSFRMISVSELIPFGSDKMLKEGENKMMSGKVLGSNPAFPRNTKRRISTMQIHLH